MEFPPEIFEKILSYADGQTLLKARYVSKTWSDIVDHFTKKTKIWYLCCVKEIPRDELIVYVHRNRNRNEVPRYRNIYRNWYMWHDIQQNIEVQVDLCPIENCRISCMAIADNYIAFGSETGRVKLFNVWWGLVATVRAFGSPIKKITFMHDEHNDKVYLIVACSRNIMLIMYDGQIIILDRIMDVNSHCVYKEYLCCEQFNGNVTIKKLKANPVIGACFDLVFTDRFHSTFSVSQVGMWDESCSIAFYNDIKRIDYKKKSSDITQNSSMLLNDVPVYDFDKTLTCDILRDDIVIYRGMDSTIQFFVLNKDNDTYILKTFNCWSVFRECITALYLYGNILVIGMESGTVYFYCVKSWAHLNLADYSKKIIATTSPIVNIGLREVCDERIFFVSTNFHVYQLYCYINRDPFIEYETANPK